MLRTIATELQSIGVPYEFMRWTGSDSDPYFVGSYTEVTTVNEDGMEEYTFTLDGFTHDAWLELETMRQSIRHHFPSVGGFRASTDNGRVAIFYDNSFPVDTGEAQLKRIQINLNVKQWKGEEQYGGI